MTQRGRRPYRKGGRRVRPDGYVDLWAPQHPLARKDGYVFEHRKIAWDEGLLTNPVLEVHHKNHLRSDNRLDNFEIKGQAQHALDHVEARGWVINQHGVWRVKPREQRANAPRPVRSCLYCGDEVSLTRRRDALYCGDNCRIAMFRQRHPGRPH
jgi:hypothetical protein